MINNSPTALARTTDPQSSHDAAAKVVSDGQQLQQQKQVLIMLNRAGASTASELSTFASKHYSTPIEKEVEYLKFKRLSERRLPELKQAGLVSVERVRRCNVTDRAAQEWRITPIGHAAATELERELQPSNKKR